MLDNIQNKDIRTKGYVLRRTNYGESDRILNLITPHGKISAIAKSVRKEKSKLAGSIEMFTLTDFNIHFGKAELGVVTGAKMIEHYGEIIKDLAKIELASSILKEISKVSEGSDSSEYFDLVDQSLSALGSGKKMEIVEIWYLLNLKKVVGEEINLYRDANGSRLASDKKYNWDRMEMAFSEDPQGEYGADEIKFLRLATTNGIEVASRIKIDPDFTARILRLVREVV